MSTETLQLRGTLNGHNGWVTQIATNPKFPDTILSCSRGKVNIEYIDESCTDLLTCVFMGGDN